MFWRIVLITFNVVLLAQLSSLSEESTTPSTSSTTVPPKPEDAYPKENISFCAEVPDCTKYASCLDCDFPDRCRYGEKVDLKCSTVRPCQREHSATREALCRFCWQTEESEHSCAPVRNCSSASSRLQRTICRVDQNVICKGRRSFFKRIRCNHTNGYSWTTTMILSVTLGGFGVDRFYLGLWKSAIGKLFSFGGVGLWTIIDIVLIATGYVGPSDGSLYI